MSLPRYTPLKATKGLNRGVGTLARTGIKRTPKDGTPGKPLERTAGKRSTKRTSKPAKGMSESKARRLVRDRSGGWCEVRLPEFCQGRATNFQHRKAQGQGGLWTPSNGLDVCGMGNYSGCHGYIHQHPTEAVVNGWTVESHGNERKTEVLLFRAGGRRVRAVPDDLGAWTPAQPHPKQQGGKAA